jgi:hypothetical protein
MNHFPHLMALILDKKTESTMFDFEDVNLILSEMAEQGIVEPMIEPIDEKYCHPLDWAEVTGVLDEVFEDIYPYAEG